MGVAKRDDGAVGGERRRLPTGERIARSGASRFAGAAPVVLGLNVPRDDRVYHGKRRFSRLMIHPRRRKFTPDESTLWSLWRPAMREIHASQAHIPLRRRLDEAERGETLAIRRRAGTIALDERVSAGRAGRGS
jgi:hypothetical protein